MVSIKETGLLVVSERNHSAFDCSSRSDVPLMWVMKRLRTNPSYGKCVTKSCKPTDKYDEILLSVWTGMIKRCYHKKEPGYKNYGAKGIFVDERWWDAANFIRDVRYLPNYQYKIGEPDKYHLDKDFFGSNCYSADTCVWLHMAENAIYRTGISPVCVMSPIGTKTYYLTTQEASEYLLVSEKQVRSLLAGKNTTIGKQGWKAYYMETGNYVLRRALADALPEIILTNEQSEYTYHA